MLADVARFSAECIESYRRDDGALSETYRGMLTLNGAEFRFKCAVYTDTDGARFVMDVQEFAAVQWTAQVHVIGGSR